jgi:hypothetical protein
MANKRRQRWQHEEKRKEQHWADNRELNSTQVRTALLRLARLAYRGESDESIERALFADPPAGENA